MAVVVKRSLPWLVCAIAACSTGKSAGSTSPDAGGKTMHAATDAGHIPMDAGSMPAAPVAVDAGKQSDTDYTIYPVVGDTCPAKPFPPGLTVVPTHDCPGAGMALCHNDPCHSDADCTEHPRGHCAGFDQGQGTIELTRCMYEDCETHADCATDEACVCSGGWRYCLAADCKSDAECPMGEHCIRVDAPCTPGPLFVCTNPADACRTASDCMSGNACVASQRGVPLACTTIICGD